MTEDKRFVKTFCLKTDDEFIPFWELDFFEEEDEGQYYRVKDDYARYYGDLIECYWDTQDKVLVFGKIKEIKSEPKEFFSGESVYIEMDGKNYGYFREAVIKDIVYQQYETSIRKVKSIEKYELDLYFTKEEQLALKPEDIYEIRTWIPYYELEDGELIKWEYKIKKKFVKDLK